MMLRRTAPLSRARTIAYCAILAVSVVLLYFLYAREMRFFVVPSRSMEPTIVPPEYVLTLNERQYARGDIVVIEDPESQDGYLVKRIVGLPGDVIEVRGFALFINGSYASEPYLAEEMEYVLEPYTVGPDEVFVLGDNRNWSVDSHRWSDGRPRGVPMNTIIGKVRYVYLPISKARKVESYPLTNVEGA